MFYKNILLQTITEKINFTNKNLILEAKDLTKNPLFSTILFLFQYDLVDKNSLSNNVNVREELKKGVPIKKIKSMFSKEDLEKITKNDGNNQMIDNEIKNYQNLLDDTQTVTHDNIFNGKSLFDAENQKNLTFNEFQSIVHSRMSKIALNKKVEIKNDGKNTYEDLKNEFVYDNNSLQVYKATKQKQCIEYVYRVSKKDKRNYSFCISQKQGNLFYKYKYQDREAAIFFVYDSILPPENPLHLLVIGVRPQYDGSFLFMITEGDNNHSNERENIYWKELITYYPKLEPLYTVFTQNLEPVSDEEISFGKKYSSVERLKYNWDYLVSPEGVEDLHKIFSFIEYDIPFELFSDKRLPAQLQHEYIYNVEPKFTIEMLKELKNKEDLYFVLIKLKVENDNNKYLDFPNWLNIEKFKKENGRFSSDTIRNLVRTFSFDVVVEKFNILEEKLFNFLSKKHKNDLKHIKIITNTIVSLFDSEIKKGNYNVIKYLLNKKDEYGNDYIIEKDKIKLFFMKHPNFILGHQTLVTDEILWYVLVEKSSNIKYIKNPSESMQLFVIKKNKKNIKHIKNPTDKVQRIIIKTENPDLIQEIYNYSEKYKNYIRAAKYPRAISDYYKLNEMQKRIILRGYPFVIREFDNPSEDLQKLATYLEIHSTYDLKNPCEHVILRQMVYLSSYHIRAKDNIYNLKEYYNKQVPNKNKTEEVIRTYNHILNKLQDSEKLSIIDFNQ